MLIERVLVFLNNLPERLLYEVYRKKHNLPKDFGFNGENIRIKGQGRLVCYAKYIGSNSQISIDKGCVVMILSGTTIGHNVTIRTSTSHTKPPQDVTIGTNCWIGNNVFICQGTTIRDNCTIGANSVVTHDIPDGETWAGNPAKKIK